MNPLYAPNTFVQVAPDCPVDRGVIPTSARDLAKQFGWGFHVNADGKVAVYGRESAEYRRLAETGPGQPAQVIALRNKRG